VATLATASLFCIWQDPAERPRSADLRVVAEALAEHGEHLTDAATKLLSSLGSQERTDAPCGPHATCVGHVDFSSSYSSYSSYSIIRCANFSVPNFIPRFSGIRHHSHKPTSTIN
jgi:hypothetical protein